MLKSRFIGFCLTAALLTCPAGVCAPPASAQPPVSAANPVPPAPAAPPASVTPAQGAAQALDQAHAAKTVSALNPYLTNESAAFLGFILVRSDSLISRMASTIFFLTGMASAFTPNEKPPQAATEQAATEKRFQDKMDALLNRYSLTDKMLHSSKKADSLPPALITRGHQFLSDASALSEPYEKSHASAKSKTIGSQMNGSHLPTSSQCTFKVLSPTHIKIVPRSNPKSPLDAHLEGGQWRIDIIGLKDDYAPSHAARSKPKPKTISVPTKPKSKPKPKSKTHTRQVAAFFQAVVDGDVAAVGKMLQANPTLASLRPRGDYEGDTGPNTNPPLFAAVFFDKTPDEIPVVALLLKAGAKVDAEDEDGETPLADAAVFDRKEAAALLLAHGAAVGHRNRSGETALHEAVWHDSFDTAKLLLAHGADVNARDNTGKTPLAVALSRSDYKAEFAAIINLLRQHGAKE